MVRASIMALLECAACVVGKPLLECRRGMKIRDRGGEIGTFDSLFPNGVLTEMGAIIQDTAIYSAISMT